MSNNKIFDNISAELSQDVICLSHLRWDFVYQRPQHLMSRFAANGRVFYFEEPIFTDGETHLEISERGENLFVCVPHINHADGIEKGAYEIEREMLDELISGKKIKNFIQWFYTPMALEFADHLKPRLVVFDCMDELSAFKFAPPELVENERKLLEKADLVFTGGQSLYEAKKDKHARVFAFPSSIDVEHFRQARTIKNEPDDQAKIAAPKLGFCGVIDERMDTHLLAELADLRPDWQFVMIGPVVKIAPEDLPRRSNIHYLGGKNYNELPAYLSGWNIALMPFAINESTKYISPTKTPEYLAAGKCVISTPIRDVVRPYADEKLVRIAQTAEDFAAEADKILERGNFDEWREKADEFLAQNSWDKTFNKMKDLIEGEISAKFAKTETALA
ncbi:MAG: glycosyltransferase family 1 protein [Pyrinomonadaceae bacterium]